MLRKAVGYFAPGCACAVWTGCGSGMNAPYGDSSEQCPTLPRSPGGDGAVAELHVFPGIRSARPRPSCRGPWPDLWPDGAFLPLSSSSSTNFILLQPVSSLTPPDPPEPSSNNHAIKASRCCEWNLRLVNLQLLAVERSAGCRHAYPGLKDVSSRVEEAAPVAKSGDNGTKLPPDGHQPDSFFLH